jgi:hypothetical protein
MVPSRPQQTGTPIADTLAEFWLTTVKDRRGDHRFHGKRSGSVVRTR